MVGLFALLRRAYIERTVTVALGRQCAQTLWSQQLAGHDVEHTLALATVERGVVESDGHSHIRAYRRVGVCAVDIIIEVAVLVEECVDECGLCLVGEGSPFVAAFFVAGHIGGKRRGKHQSVVP